MNAFIAAHHRHNKPVQGDRFRVGAAYGGGLVGVACCGNPVARLLDDGLTAEVTRNCVAPGAPRNACSFLYGALWRAWRSLGGRRLITYTLASEPGASLRAAGFRAEAELAARPPGGWCSRPGRAAQAVVAEPKIRWVLTA